MKDVVSKYLWLFIEVLLSAFSIVMVISIFENTHMINTGVTNYLQQSIIADAVLVEYETPRVDEANLMVSGAILELNSVFDWKDYVKAVDAKGTDILNYVVADTIVDTAIPGVHGVNFTLNWNGESITKYAEFYVNE